MAEGAAGAVIAADAGLPEAMQAAMISHATDTAPLEACGLVAYDGLGHPARLYRLTNIDPDPGRFEIDPVEHVRVIREVEARGWRIGAVYHSHPRGPARPSPADLAAGIDRDWISFVVGRRRGRWRIAPYLMKEEGAEPLSGDSRAWPGIR